MSNKNNSEAKDNKVKETKVAEEASQGKTEEELKEIATTLRTQLQHHQTMAVKAQGALEVILQMIPQENDGEEG
jgi:hypothetical protein